MENACRKELVRRMKLMSLRLVKAVAFATWLYSLLFLMYLTFRLTLNAAHVRLDDLFIDRVPFFTFLTTGIFLLVINLVSLVIYMALRRANAKQKGSIGGNEADRSFGSMSARSTPSHDKDALNGRSGSIGLGSLNLMALTVCLLSISIWGYLTYLSLANPPSPPYWPISMMMFVISYVCMVYMMTARDSRVSHRSA